jgi:predicted  nucleic acid-binding Zn-ribbon protein
MKLTDRQQHEYLAAILLEVRALKDQVKSLEKEIKDLKKTVGNHTHTPINPA